MRKVIFIFLLLISVKAGFSQNVGIGTTAPQSKLDINGDIAFRSADITITTTYNYALDVNTEKQSHYKLKSPILPLGNFIIAGITSAVDGRIITLANRTNFSMELYNEDATAVLENRITTGTGGTFAVYNGGTVSLRYDASSQRWEIINSHYNSLDYFGGGGGTSYWDLTGNDIKNNNTGNVGIGGSPSAGYKLYVKGNAALRGNSMAGVSSVTGLEIYSTDVTGTQFLKFDGQKMQSYGSPNIQTSSTPKDLCINPYGGKVGIGLFSPRCKLSILSNTVLANNNTDVFQISGKNPVMWLSEANGTDYGYIKGVTDISATPQFPTGGLEIGAVPGTNLFLSANYSPALTVAQNNLIGIGTTSPTSALSFANVLGKKISFWNSGANNDFGIGIQSGEMQFYTAGQDIISFGYGSSNSYNRTMAYYPGTAQLGINCLPQAGYNLAVKGHIRSTEIVVESGWADYVFDENYKLPDLATVEASIKLNKHLPGIPSAKEIETNGLKVGEVQTKMMEKIEELTLYIIELKKEIELLKRK